jgi:DNA cross-link repair 1B protein
MLPFTLGGTDPHQLEVAMRLPHTPFHVDEFCLPAGVAPAYQPVFFLTHAHTDHLQGLRKDWTAGPLYASAVTKSLILQKFGMSPAVVVCFGHLCCSILACFSVVWNAVLQNALPLDEPQTLYLDDAKTQSVRVTFMDANHCPGAVMILFEGFFGTYLHTGDFR